ncbi:MAG: TonB-dependent receptor, partial [Bacteroidota bacterium]
MKHFLISFAFVLYSLISSGQKAILTGIISDSLSTETIPGATVYIPKAGTGAISSEDGTFKVKLKPGEYVVEISFTGYNKKKIEVSLTAGEVKNIQVSLSNVTLKAVEINAYISDYTSGTAMSRTKLDMATIKVLPAFLGEVDLLKTIQLLPGVQAAGEGNSGFYVRGGGPDQNLILFDDAVVYNASHLLGFFSVFNSDAIEDVELYKGGMPAEYGERLASVIDITQRKGSKDRFRGQGGLGLISSRLTLEGPISKGKSSFIVSGRRTYVDALVTPFIPEDSQ